MRTTVASRVFSAIVVLLLLAAIIPARAETFVVEQLDGVDVVSGEILVKFTPAASQRAIDVLASIHGSAELYASPFSGVRRMSVPPGRTIEQMIEVFSRNPLVEYAEPNSVCSAFMVPDDSYYGFQWNMERIGMPAAWDLQPEAGAGVIVAVIDTGIAYENRLPKFRQAPDLANTAFATGYDYINNDPYANDDNGHGTHVAGTIAQSTNNAYGVAGIAFGATLMPVKVLNSQGSGTAQALADGLYFAANKGAKVANMSLGWSPGVDPGTTVHDAVTYAWQKGVTLVCAAGNDNVGIISYPAAYAECISVGATDYADERAYYSNWGNLLDIVAPGGDVNQDPDGDGYGAGILQQTFGSRPSEFGFYFYQGTSMATPHVTGVAALIVASGITQPDQVRLRLTSTAKDLGDEGWDSVSGCGLVNAHAALVVGPPTPEPLQEDMYVTSLQGKSVILYKNLWKAEVTATIGSANGPVSGANVSISWSTGSTASGVTGADGTLVFTSEPLRKSPVTLTVTNVSASGYEYDPEQNKVSSITTPR